MLARLTPKPRPSRKRSPPNVYPAIVSHHWIRHSAVPSRELFELRPVARPALDLDPRRAHADADQHERGPGVDEPPVPGRRRAPGRRERHAEHEREHPPARGHHEREHAGHEERHQERPPALEPGGEERHRAGEQHEEVARLGLEHVDLGPRPLGEHVERPVEEQHRPTDQHEPPDHDAEPGDEPPQPLRPVEHEGPDDQGEEGVEHEHPVASGVEPPLRHAERHPDAGPPHQGRHKPPHRPARARPADGQERDQPQPQRDLADEDGRDAEVREPPPADGIPEQHRPQQDEPRVGRAARRRGDGGRPVSEAGGLHR